MPSELQTCWKCGQNKPTRSYKSEREEGKVYHICEECEEELQM